MSVNGLCNLAIIFSTPSTLLSSNHCYYNRGTYGAQRCKNRDIFQLFQLIFLF